MKIDIDKFECSIKQGPGWKASQICERDKIIKQIEQEKNALKDMAIELQNSKEDIGSAETNIEVKDKICDNTLKEVKCIEEAIGNSTKRFMEVQKQLHDFDNRLAMKKLSLSQEREEEASLKIEIKRKVMKRQAAQEKINENQNDIERISRNIKDIVKTRDKILAELQNQIEKNRLIEVQNTEKVSKKEETARQMADVADETETCIKKKEILSQMIVEAEKERVSLEAEKDELKVKMNKSLHIEMSMKKKEHESHKRQKEALQREMLMLERKKDLCEKTSDVILGVTRSSEVTFKTLQHDLEALHSEAKCLQKKIQSQKEVNMKHTNETYLASRKFESALANLRSEEMTIQSIQMELETNETLLKEKQKMCEALKNECNVRSKILVINHEDIEKANKEYNVINRQINQIKVDITHIEDDLVTEHFNHHHTSEEKESLRAEKEEINKYVDEVDNEIDYYKKEMIHLHQTIHAMDRECDKLVKDYGTITGYRDSIDNMLLRKKDDLEKIQASIKIQQSMLRHSASEYKEQVLIISTAMEKLKHLNYQKKAVEEESIQFDDCLLKCRSLEAEVKLERSKNFALKEELGRPFNVHRWRKLELQYPEKFDKIQTIQKLQKSVIITADAVAEKERSLRETESAFFRNKRVAERQPQMEELTQQVKMYEAALNEKYDQMKSIEIELSLAKRDVEQSRKKLTDLDTERNKLKSMWIDSAKQQ